ncbi:MAG: multicopper oxidase family protein [Thermotaleaceae bacterium]
MSKKAITLLFILALIVTSLSIVVYLQNTSSMNMESMGNNAKQNSSNKVLPLSKHSYAENIVNPKPGQPIKKFNLIALEGTNEIRKGEFKPIWGYNGKVPGQEIRVTEGDFVEVTLKNILPEPVTIHWHGYPLNSAMDGVPGVNQDAIRTGESFTYKFSADVPGTYWYHSHQQGSKQVDKGLYGALIVEPKSSSKPDKDFTLILDEWTESNDDMESMEGMDMGGANESFATAEEASLAEEEGMREMYNIYTVNGKSGDSITPLEVKQGDVVRLRFINAGYRTHTVHIPGTNIKVVSTDGQEINGAQIVKDKLVSISPGERYDIEFTVENNQSFYIDFHDSNLFNDQIKIPVLVDGNQQEYIKDGMVNLELLDLSDYGIPSEDSFTLEQDYNDIYEIDLGIQLNDGTLQYTINGQIFNELPPLILKNNNLVQVTYTNKSNVDHPMHLHGHFFQVIAKDGKPVKGATLSKDTLLIKPNESYTIAFEADNPGNWVQHCHELHHAAGGMMQEIKYIGFKSNYTLDPANTFNNPE